MEEKKNKKLNTLIIVGIILVLVTGVTIAYFMSRQTGTETTVTAKDLAITYTNENKFNIDSQIEPISESEILTSAPKVEFTVTNTAQDNAYIQIDIVDISLNKFKDYDFKWALYQGEEKVTTGSFISEEDSKITLAAGKELVPSTPTVYSVYVWINETNKDQGRLMGGSFTGTVQVTAYGSNNTLAGKIFERETKKLVQTYEYIGCSESCVAANGANGEKICYDDGYCEGRTLISEEIVDVPINTTPTFSQTLSTDRGLFVQKDDSTKSEFGFPTYYYRGSETNTNEGYNPEYVMNNYVSFGTYKTTDGGNTVGDPIIWKIMRINEDGSIKLVSHNAVSSNIKYDITDPRTSNYIGSNLESTINTWYNNNIGSNSGTTLDNEVQTGNFCNDFSNSGKGAAIRNGITVDDSGLLPNVSPTSVPNPIFTCPNDGGVMINSKAGTYTVDEITYAGGTYYDYMNISYLWPSGDLGSFTPWTMTPYMNKYSFNIAGLSISLGHFVNPIPDIPEDEGPGVPSYTTRAVINLKPDVVVSSGDGSSSNPYVIK